jgi:hypothetical protein
MGSYIDSAKTNIESIVQKLIAYEKCDLRFGLVAYRDHPPQDSTFATRVFPFVVSLRKMKENLAELSANGGGDGPEAVATGLYDSLHMPWRKDATKVVVLISDAPPHGLGESGDGFPDGEPNGHDPIAIAHEMAKQEITVYSVGCEPAIQSFRFARAFLCSVAEITSGQAVALSNAQLLADVILGGAVEELGLARLMDEVQQEVANYTTTAAARGDDLSEEAVSRYVTGVMHSKGVRTKQMMTNTNMADVHSSYLTGAKCLSEARGALSSVPPTPVCNVALAPGSYGGYAESLDCLDTITAAAPRRGSGGIGGAVRSFFGMFGSVASSSSAATEAPAAPSGALMDLALPAGETKELERIDMPYSADPSSSPTFAAAPAYSRPMTEEVSLGEADISYAQVKRMVHKVNLKSA